MTTLLSVSLGRLAWLERTLTIMTTDGEMMNEPVRPVIDDELVDRLMARVDEEGLELVGPEGC